MLRLGAAALLTVSLLAGRITATSAAAVSTLAVNIITIQSTARAAITAAKATKRITVKAVKRMAHK